MVSYQRLIKFLCEYVNCAMLLKIPDMETLQLAKRRLAAFQEQICQNYLFRNTTIMEYKRIHNKLNLMNNKEN